ncbi:hypothetical protein Y032_0050g1998 [Ancylostoma ceylanicum]|uniref:Uncharacterized protein n=1 Tax=Ancylostoma ceylanicum TaxID=53326 RepID=A0A016UAL0_9BILA|nr:hypothetical protein Y032_0050g1998 [Ancylostoma ceylanicum]
MTTLDRRWTSFDPGSNTRNHYGDGGEKNEGAVGVHPRNRLNLGFYVELTIPQTYRRRQSRLPLPRTDAPQHPCGAGETTLEGVGRYTWKGRRGRNLRSANWME